jgi:putative phosphoribosyl transferase
VTQARFRDRSDAGQRLAGKLMEYAHQPDLLVLALPRGGVPVAYEVARALDAPLDVFLVRKLGVPGHEELAMGAIATGGVRVLNREVVNMLRIPPPVIDAVAAKEQQELERRERAYRGDRPEPDVRGRTVILVDDGLATGSTMRAAAEALREEGAERLIVAVPVAPPETCGAFQSEVDEIICAITPEPFYGVGMWYEDFTQTTDEEVRDLLARARMRDEAVDDTVLEARVRSELGRLVSNPGAIQVTAEQGRVTLAGSVLASEVERLVAGVEGVRGVREVANRMEAQREPGNVPDLQGATSVQAD